MENNFNDIFEELTWEMYKMSGGNPYIIQDIVQGRNRKRENTKDIDKEL